VSIELRFRSKLWCGARIASVFLGSYATRVARSGTLAVEGDRAVSYAGTSQDAQGSLRSGSENGSRRFTSGKQTLVEHVVAPAMVHLHVAGTHNRSEESTGRAVVSKGVATPSSALPFLSSIQRADVRADRIASAGIAGRVPRDDELVGVYAGECPGRGRPRRFEFGHVARRERLAKQGGS
jgi:hypothetical protein